MKKHFKAWQRWPFGVLLPRLKQGGFRRFWVLFLLALSCSFFAAPAIDQPLQDDQTVTRFRSWYARYEIASVGTKANLLPEGIALAKARREALKQVIRDDPARALGMAESSAVRKQLPAEVANLLEERVSGVGDIRVVRGQTEGVSADGLAREVIVNGRVYAAHVYGWRLVDQDFSGVPLQGVAVDDELALAESPLRVLDAEEVVPQQRQAGKIATEVGGQLQFFPTQEDVARAELELMYGRGMPVPGPEQQATAAREKKIRRVHPNALAWQRTNERRKQKGLPSFSQEEMNVVPFGQELELENGGMPADAGAPPMTVGSTDNSALQYFPPIRSQGSLGSCACFSTTYYQMTHMTALARGWDAKNGGDTLRFSPKWTYNMVNGGSDSGSWEYWSLNVQRDHGCATWAEFPYDSNYRAWCLNSNVWRVAIGHRMNAYSTIASVYTTNGLANLKAILDNGYVVTFDTYSPWSYQGWVQGTVGNDPATTNDDPYVGQYICKYVRALDWGHAMTVVGYNDDLWCDLNGNSVVDSGEKGALKIANSWGNYSDSNGGYLWFAYDALKTASAVSGWNPSDKVYGFGYGDSASNCIVYVTTARTNYNPKLLAKFTINHAQRNQLTMKVGKDGVTVTNNPATQWTGYGLSGDGGAYAFDGTTNACDGTFWLDMSDLSPELFQQKRYFVAMSDSATAGSGQIKSYTLVDTVTGEEITVTPNANPNSFNPSNGLANAATAWGFLDHVYGMVYVTGVSASSGTYKDRIVVSWLPISVATAYELWRSDRAINDPINALLQITTAALSYTNMPVTPGMVYYYWLKAITPQGTTDLSAAAGGWASWLPDIPSGVSATSGQTNNVHISWSAALNAVAYTVYRHTANISASASVIAQTNATQYDDASAVPGVTYYYWVRAQDSFGDNSDYSSPATGSCVATPTPPAPDPVPSAPAWISASDGIYSNKVRLTWAFCAYATRYEVWRRTPAGAESIIGLTSSTGLDDTNVVLDATYYYWVIAKNARGSSAASPVNSGYASLTPKVDLEVTDLQWSPAVMLGRSIPDAVSTHLKNLGPAPIPSANAGVRLDFYLSPNDTFNDNDNISMGSLVRYVPLAVGQSTDISLNRAERIQLRLPPLAPGLYYVFLRAAHTSMTDQNYTNNTARATAPIEISALNCAFPPGDYDGDGITDLAIYQEATGYWFILLTGNAWLDVWKFGDAGYTPVSGDFDGDRRTDLALYQESSGYWFMILSSVSELTYRKFGAFGYAQIPADFDGDGKTDVAVYHAESGYWFILKSSNGELAYLKFGEPGYTPVPGDYDGDGKNDVAVYHEASGYWFILKSSDGELAYLKFGEPGYLPVPGDYDGDGKTDIAVYQELSGYWFIRKSETGEVAYQKFGEPGYIPVRGDFDGDGKTDIAVYNEATGYWCVWQSASQTLWYQKFGEPGYLPVE